MMASSIKARIDCVAARTACDTWAAMAALRYPEEESVAMAASAVEARCRWKRICDWISETRVMSLSAMRTVARGTPSKELTDELILGWMDASGRSSESGTADAVTCCEIDATE